MICKSALWVFPPKLESSDLEQLGDIPRVKEALRPRGTAPGCAIDFRAVPTDRV